MRDDIQVIEKMPNTLNISIYHKLGRFLIFCDASFSCGKGKSGYGMAIYFYNFLIVAGAFKGKKSFSAKE